MPPMQTWPFDVDTVTVTWGNVADGRGQSAPVVARITAVFTSESGAPLARILWGPTGFSYLPRTEALLAKPGVTRSAELPAVDQPGWFDPAGNAYSGWYYEVVLELGYGRELTVVTHRIQPVMGQATIALGELPDPTEVGKPTQVQVPAVLSVDGKTGHVTTAAGSAGGAGVEYAMPEPRATWTIPHKLGRRPVVSLYDDQGVEFDTDIVATASVVVVTFPEPTRGSAVLS